MSVLKSDAVTAGIMPDFAQAGVLLCRTGSYEISTAAAGATIQLVPVPKDAEIVDVMIRTEIPAAGSASVATLEIGDGSDNDRFFSLLTGSATKHTNLYGGSGNVGFMKIYDTDETIDAYIDSAMGTGFTIYLKAVYKMRGSISDETN